MKLDTKTLDKLFAGAFITAAAAWLAAVIIAGILAHSFSFALLMALACGLYVFGYFNFSGMNSYDKKFSSKRYLYWCLMAAGLIFAAILFSRQAAGWMWWILCILQVFPLIMDHVIDVNVSEKFEGDRQRRTREQMVQKASQSTNIHDFASALGMNVIDLRGDKEKNIEQRAGAGLSPEDEGYARRLVAIFREMDALFSTDKAAYDHKRNEARQIGQTLGDHGGSDRMTLVAYRVQALGGRARDCEHAWDGICGWMA